MRPVTHPRHRAHLLQQARRLRFDSEAARGEGGNVDGAVFESAQLWGAEREAFSEWMAYAATILEAGAGGIQLGEDLDGAGGETERPRWATSPERRG